MPGNTVVSLAVARAVGIDAWLNKGLLAYQRLERPVKGRAEIRVQFALRPARQTLRRECGVDAAREWHA